MKKMTCKPILWRSKLSWRRSELSWRRRRSELDEQRAELEEDQAETDEITGREIGPVYDEDDLEAELVRYDQEDQEQERRGIDPSRARYERYLARKRIPTTTVDTRDVNAVDCPWNGKEQQELDALEELLWSC